MFLPNHGGLVHIDRMSDPSHTWIETTNWLAHRWDIELETRSYGQWMIHIGKVEGYRVSQTANQEEYERWCSQHRPACLARLIADWPSVHPAAVLVVAGEYRLGKVRPELWCGYDATLLMDLPQLTLLSAKVRAMFPEWPTAMIRVVREGEVAGLGLKAAPDARRARLRAVA